MDKPFSHSILVVDEDQSIGKLMGDLFSDENIRVIHAPSGEAGLEKIHQREAPFSIIISDEGMPGIQGHEFLRETVRRSPDSIRYLITECDSLDNIVQAINLGRVHKIIKKPWENTLLLDTVKQSLEDFELIQEERFLFKTAKVQNKKLYTLKKQLLANINAHKLKIADLDTRIQSLEQDLSRLHPGSEALWEQEQKCLQEMIRQNGPLNQERLNTLYVHVLDELLEQLTGIASRSNIDLDMKNLWN